MITMWDHMAIHSGLDSQAPCEGVIQIILTVKDISTVFPSLPVRATFSNEAGAVGAAANKIQIQHEHKTNYHGFQIKRTSQKSNTNTRQPIMA